MEELSDCFASEEERDWDRITELTGILTLIVLTCRPMSQATVRGGGGNRTRSLVRLILGRIERKFLMLPLLRQNVFSRKGFRMARGTWSCSTH